MNLLNQAVGKRGFAVIDMRNYAKVAYMRDCIHSMEV
jgi:hypothetical protein